MTLATPALLLAALALPASDDPWVDSVAAADAAPIVVALDSSGVVHLLDSDLGERLAGAPADVRVVRASWVDVDPSGERVVLLDLEGGVHLWRWREQEAPALVATIEPSATMKKGRTYPFGSFLRFSPTGERIAVGVHGSQVLLLDGQGAPVGEAAALLAEEELVAGSWFDAPLAWSGDGRRLAAVTTGGPLLFDATTAARVDVAFDVGDVVLRSVALDATGARVALGGSELTLGVFSAEDGARAWWGPLDCEGSEISIFGTDHLSVAGLAFSLDGAQLACSTAESSHAAIVDASTGANAWSGTFHGGRMGEPRAVVWSPSGERLFHTYASGAMKLVHTARAVGEDGQPVYEERYGGAGSPPDAGLDGTGVTTDRRHVIALDLETGEELWRTTL